MRSAVFIIYMIFQASNGFAQQMDSAFMHLACQQCNTLCPAQQRSVPQGPPRVGKAGPRGLPGPIGGPGIVNLTEMEQMIDRKVNAAVGYLSTRSCRDIKAESAKSTNTTGGVFDIFIPMLGQIEVYCDIRTDGGNWIVFQRRMDGSVDFFRDWDDYVIGFGSTSGEFWLGLEAIHQLTRSGIFELRIDMIEQDGTHYHAKYSSFKVGPASDNYRLKANGYSGNVPDSFASGSYPASNMAFSTRDQDNDRWASNCAASYKGGWWYNNCHWTNLNGLYDKKNSEAIRWYYPSVGKDLIMKFTEMKFRLKQ